MAQRGTSWHAYEERSNGVGLMTTSLHLYVITSILFAGTQRPSLKAPKRRQTAPIARRARFPPRRVSPTLRSAASAPRGGGATRKAKRISTWRALFVRVERTALRRGIQVRIAQVYACRGNTAFQVSAVVSALAAPPPSGDIHIHGRALTNVIYLPKTV